MEGYFYPTGILGKGEEAAQDRRHLPCQGLDFSLQKPQMKVVCWYVTVFLLSYRISAIASVRTEKRAGINTGPVFLGCGLCDLCNASTSTALQKGK